MRAGELRHRITIEKCVKGQDSAGQVSLAWLPRWKAVPMGLVQQRGSESASDKQTGATGRLVMQCRWRKDVSVEDRVIWDGRTFGITSVDDPDGKKWEMVLNVSEGRP
jgi:SPP1 family predicted phage head-tail adaptor